MSLIGTLHRGLVARVDDADLPWPSRSVARRGAIVGVAFVVAAGMLGGWAAVAIGFVALGVGLAVVLDSCRGRAARHVDESLPDVLEAAGRSLRSGASLRTAIREGAEHAPDRLRDGLAMVVAAVERGVPLEDAIDGWAIRTPGDGVRLASAALALAAELGGAAARSLDGVAATLRDRNAVRREVQALSSQARASALVIAVAPAGFAFVAAGVDPRALDFLFRTRFGTACLLLGVVLDGVGAVWMNRLAAVP